MVSNIAHINCFLVFFFFAQLNCFKYFYVSLFPSVFREKRALVKTASKSYRKNPTNTNARKLEKAQYQLTGIYLKKQSEYIQNQMR